MTAHGFPPSMSNWRDIGGWTVGRHPEVVRRAACDAAWPGRTIADFAAERADADPGRILIVDGDRALTTIELYDMARHLAGWFDSVGIVAGEVIAFQLPNWWEASVVNLAAAMIGAVINPIVPINRDAELTHMLGKGRARIIFIPETFRGFDHAAMLRRVSPGLDRPPLVVTVRGGVSEFSCFEDLLRVAPIGAPRAVDPRAVKLLMYTSGTTGRPKAVLHSHDSLHADGVYLGAAMALGADDRVFCPSPLTHISGYLWVLNMPWLAGIPAFSVDQWDSERAFALLRDHRASVMIGATPFLRDLVARIEHSGETLAALRHYVCGGAAVPPGLIYRAAELLPNCIPWRTFGATETTTLTRGPTTRAEISQGAETDGRLWTAEAKVVRGGVSVAAGEEGELLVRGPGLMLGYVDPADNAAAFDADGFFRMGDLVRRSGDNHLVCTGRVKDLIIRSGENISAKEIEDVLTAAPEIVEAAVVAMPNARTGEAVCAFLILAPGAAIDLPTIDALIRAAGLARQKTPEHLVIVGDLPRTAAGKVRKDVLRAQVAAGA